MHVFVWASIQKLSGAQSALKWCPVQEKQINIPLCPTFLFIHTAQMFAAIVCLQHNALEFSKRRRRNGKTTARNKQYTTMLAEYGVCFSARLEKLTFHKMIVKSPGRLENLENKWILLSYASRIQWR